MSSFAPPVVTSNVISTAGVAPLPNSGLNGNTAQGFGGQTVQAYTIQQDRNVQKDSDRRNDSAPETGINGDIGKHQEWKESPFTEYVKLPLSDGQLLSDQKRVLNTVRLGRPAPKYWIRYDAYTIEKEADIFADVAEAVNLSDNGLQMPTDNRDVYLEDETVLQSSSKPPDIMDQQKEKAAPLQIGAGEVVIKEHPILQSENPQKLEPIQDQTSEEHPTIAERPPLEEIEDKPNTEEFSSSSSSSKKEKPQIKLKRKFNGEPSSESHKKMKA